MSSFRARTPQPVLDGSEIRDRLLREKQYFDQHGGNGFKDRRWIARLSGVFYDKTARGRLWAPVWRTVDLRGKKVLDYGCGDGAFSSLLVSRGAMVCGIDISSELIKRAQTANPAQPNGFPQFFVADAHHTPFPDGQFDLVFGNGALHHLDLMRAYGEIARVLKPEGRAFFQEPMYYHPLIWLLRRLTPKLHTEDERPLGMNEIAGAGRWFRKVRHREHFFLAVCAAPVHLVGRRAALAVIGGIDRADQILMRIAPPLRRLAWLTMLEMEK